MTTAVMGDDEDKPTSMADRLRRAYNRGDNTVVSHSVPAAGPDGVFMNIMRSNGMLDQRPDNGGDDRAPW